MKRYVILDRDGTIIEERNYLSDPEHVAVIPGAIAGLHALAKIGLKFIIVTNQSGVGRGYFTLKDVDLVHVRMRQLLAKNGVTIDGIYICPHRPDDHCTCRKPNTGLVDQAVEHLDFDPRCSFVIGDKPCDIELGKRVHATTILVKTGYGAQYAGQLETVADYIVDDLTAAYRKIQPLVP